MDASEFMIVNEWGIEIVVKDAVQIDDTNFLHVVTSTLLKCKELNKNRLLIDLTNFTRKTIAAKLFEAVNISEQIIGMGIKIAFLASHLVNDDASIRVETSGYQKGIFIQYFPNRQMAIDWLLK